MRHNAHMYEIVGGLRASLLSAVKRFATGSGVVYTYINPQYFIHDVEYRNLLTYIFLQLIVTNGTLKVKTPSFADLRFNSFSINSNISTCLSFGTMVFQPSIKASLIK